jgi:hypothetical protein
LRAVYLRVGKDDDEGEDPPIRLIIRPESGRIIFTPVPSEHNRETRKRKKKDLLQSGSNT